MNSHFNQKFDIDVYFTIKYYAHKPEKTITRRAKWDSQCRYWTSKLGDLLMTYFDIDKQGYRTAKGSWTVRF